MAKQKVGQILDNNKKYNRDAIHVPIMAVVAREILYAGDFVILDEYGEAFRTTRTNLTTAAGVVDPFLYTNQVLPGEKFYLFLKPESTTRLWHDWTHPLVDKKV